ncbi:MAG TPA: ATP-binding protein [Longimicrobiales bacterium]|nr:ATP-binding protein [Longimicrobiales bacterium]
MQHSAGGAVGVEAWLTLAERAPVGIAITTGADHRLEYANRAFTRIAGSPHADLCGCRPADVLNSPALTQRLDTVLQSGVPIHSAELYTAAGNDFRLSAWPRGDEIDGSGLVIELDEAVGTHTRQQETDEVREVNARLVRAALREEELAEQARAASRAKSEFLALISHELRTPLTAVIGYTDMLQTGKGGLNEQGSLWTDQIRFSAWHLRQIVDDLLSTVSENRAADEIVPQFTCADAIAREAIALVETRAGEKGLEVRLDAPPLNIPLHTDRRKVRRALANLLTNAVKFTDEGLVELKVEPNGDGVAFRVRDTGIGISEENLERIFEPFVQVDPSTTRRFGGCGLGLGLSRRFARALGGDLTVTSRLGAGSTFSLIIPGTATATSADGAGYPDIAAED